MHQIGSFDSSSGVHTGFMAALDDDVVPSENEHLKGDIPMQRGLLAVLVTVVIAGIAAIASYSAGYQAGLIASGGAVVAPIVYGGGFGFLGFFGFLFVLVLLFAL